MASFVAGTENDLEQAITLAAGSYFLLEADVTLSAGTLQPKIGSTDIGSALSATGRVREVFFTNATATLKFTKNAAGAGSVDNVSVKQLLTAHLLPGAPTQNTCMLVTSAQERFVFVGGTIPEGSTIFDPLHARWCSQEEIQHWSSGDNTPNGVASTAGGMTLEHGGRIVGMERGAGEVIIWTDEGFDRAVFVPDPNVVWSKQEGGRKCGLIGTNAASMLGGVAYWISPTGDAWAYYGAGSNPVQLESPHLREFIDNLADVQQDKVYSTTVAAYGEVWWLYPDSPRRQ